MAIYKSKFIEIDPDTCTKEELHDAIEKLAGLSGYYETKQLAIKTFINSVYGATASKYFVGHNTAVAESITLQGQDLNHYSENCVNRYFRGIFQSEEHYNKVIYVPIFEWMEKWNINDTNEFYAKNQNKEWVLVNLPITKEDLLAKNYDDAMKTLLKKNVFVKTTFGKHLGITYDQAKSIDINRGRITDQKPLDHPDLAPFFKYLGKTTYLEQDATTSATVAGDTDSTISTTKVYVDDSSLTIEELFNKCKYENYDTVLKLGNGQEIVPVKNHTTKTINPYAPLIAIDKDMKYVMRHKVSKEKYKITTQTGKELIVTGDHSIMIVRDGKLISVPAREINIKADKIIEIINNYSNNGGVAQTDLVEIKSVEQLEDFQDEYVYDIEVDDTHTFFANDILAHNSIYVEFGRIPIQLGITDNDSCTRFVVDLWNYGCGPYMDQCYEDYAKKYNCDKNIQALELEKIADTAIMVAKKHYAMSECFLEPNIYVKPGEHVLYKGLELIQGSTPPFARKCQDDFMRYILNWYVTHIEAPSFDDLYTRIKKYKEDFIKQSPDNISKSASIGDYEKFIVDDNHTFAVGLHCPIHVKAAGIHNYMLNMDRNKKYKMKYNKIKTRDKVKFYKTTDPNFNVFGFVPGKYPIEFAPAIDYNQQFEDLVLGPINRIMEILGYQQLTSDLCYTSALF